MSNFQEFWARYPGKKVAKPNCEKKYEKLSDEEHKKVMLAISAQIRYRADAKQTGEFVPEWCNSQTFINQSRWYDEIPSHADLAEKREAKICCVPDCCHKTIGPRFVTCDYHFEFTEKGYLRETMSLVTDLRKHWQEHPEIHHLRGIDAIRYAQNKAREIGRKPSHG